MLHEDEKTLIIKEFRKENTLHKVLAALLILVFYWLVLRIWVSGSGLGVYIILLGLATGLAIDFNSFEKLILCRDSGRVRFIRRSLRGSKEVGSLAIAQLQKLVLYRLSEKKEDKRLRMYLGDRQGHRVEVSLLLRADVADADKVYSSLSHWLYGSGLHCVAQKNVALDTLQLPEGADFLMYWQIEPVDEVSGQGIAEVAV